MIRRCIIICGAAGLLVGALAVLSALAQGPALKTPLAMDFIKIAPGEFVMGCSTDDAECSNDEKPAHHVQITKAFELGKYEVTQEQWQSVMGSNPSTIKGDDHPVETVSKNDAHDFLAKLNAQNDGYKYRLPTEAEWEYAARAGATAPPAKLDDVAWYGENSGDETHPVGQKKPNAWGLYDMLGNVREWVEDNFGRFTDAVAVDPTGPAAGAGGGQGGRGRGRGGSKGGRGFGPGGQKGGPKGDAKGGPGRGLPLMRGGAWDNPTDFVRISSRYHYYGPTLRVSDIGFRVARQPL